MKKVLFALLSVMAIVFTGCKFDNSTVTVTVKDSEGDPVAFRQVFYTDKVSAIAGILLPPTPDELMGWDEGSFESVKTNKQGVATIQITLGVSKLNYYFIVFDEGAKKWITKEVSIQRGSNAEVDFEVTL